MAGSQQSMPLNTAQINDRLSKAFPEIDPDALKDDHNSQQAWEALTRQCEETINKVYSTIAKTGGTASERSGKN